MSFADRLSSLGHRRITLEELRSAWLATFPEQIGEPERDRLMLAALRDMAERGALALPAPASYTRTGNPRMPKHVTLWAAERELLESDWGNRAWLPAFGFWPTLRKQSERETAWALNDWLRKKTRPLIPVPLRERSLEIFGDEKRLDGMVKNSTLFGGALTLHAIGAFTVAAPLPYRKVKAAGQPVLVVENHHSFWSLAAWNERQRAYAAVVYGGGKALWSTGEALAQAMGECEAGGAQYLGDIDPTGILIPINCAETINLDLQPATNFYGWLLKHGRRRPLEFGEDGHWPDKLRWLGDLGDDVLALWRGGEWIPQEGLGTEQLQTWGIGPGVRT